MAIPRAAAGRSGHADVRCRGRWFAATTALCSGLALGGTGCAREAPGALECQTFALSVVGVTDTRALADPRIKQTVDSWTTRCLTTPYDRELLSCVRLGQRGCYQAFAARHPDRAKRDALRGAP